MCRDDRHQVIEAVCRQTTGRGRPITLSAERTAAVEAALQADGTHTSIAAVRSAVRSWHSATREAADAAGVNRYYDEWRVQGYTQRLEALIRSKGSKSPALTAVTLATHGSRPLLPCLRAAY